VAVADRHRPNAIAASLHAVRDWGAGDESTRSVVAEPSRTDGLRISGPEDAHFRGKGGRGFVPTEDREEHAALGGYAERWSSAR
jgi:hypothetical protein